MGIEKTDDDIMYEDEAADLTASLRGTGIAVAGDGGIKGPFSVTVVKLSTGDAHRVIEAILEVTGRKPTPRA